MASTFYIDANRSNSSIKDPINKHEWEYKLSNPIMLPSGTQISLLDTFVNKKGISGSTIEIDEDFNETLNFTYYLSDNPHFVPSNQNNGKNKMYDNFQEVYKNSFIPAGPLFQQEVDYFRVGDSGDPAREKPNRGINIRNGEPIPNQRWAMFRQNSTGLPFYDYDGTTRLTDPYLFGYSEQPMMACRVSTITSGSLTGFPNNNNVTDPHYQNVAGNTPIGADKYLEPIVGQINLFIPKGVYSVGEIADILQGQMNGKYTNIKQGDNYSDFISNAENAGTYDGGFDTGGIYKKFRAVNLYGGVYNRWGYNGCFLGDVLQNNYQESPMVPNYNRPRLISNYPIYPYVAPNPSGANPDAIAGNGKPPANPDRQGGIDYTNGVSNDIPGPEQAFFLPTHNFNKLVDYWKYDVQYMSMVRDPAKYADGGLTNCPYFSTAQFVESNFRYGLQHILSRGGQDDVAPAAQNGNCILFKELYEKGDDTSAGQLDQIFSQFPPPKFNPPVPNQSFMPIGLHTKRATHNCPNYSGNMGTAYNPYLVYGGIPKQTQETPPVFNWGTNVEVGVTAEGFNANITHTGYYLGTPDFTFSYDTDKNAFTVGNLHQNKRIPSADQWGNKMSNEGTTAAFIRKCSQDASANIPVRGGPPFPAEYYRANNQIVNSLKVPETRVGGIAIFNWAYQTALKYGDIDIDSTIADTYYNPATNRLNDPDKIQRYREYNSDDTTFPSDLKERKLMKYYEFFSTIEKAKEAWEKTLWFKLGFTYENLQDEENWERAKYYDIPNNLNDVDGPTQFDRMGYRQEDFVVYGKTTKADLGPSVAPTISTTNQPDIFTMGQGPGGKDPGGNVYAATPFSVRTYDNTDTITPFSPLCAKINAFGTIGDEEVNSVAWKYYQNSMYRGAVLTSVNTESREIIANTLPSLSTSGYYLITSNIVDNWRDDLKQGSPLPLLGIVPLSNLSNQDFITTKNDLIHTISQPKILNSIKIKILKPDLTPPLLEDGSSVILAITTPIPQTNPLQPNQTDEGNTKKTIEHPQKDPMEKTKHST